MFARHKIFLAFVGISYYASTAMLAMAADEPTSKLPFEYAPLIEKAADELYESIEPGLRSMTDESGTASLIEVVKTLRDFGYGSSSPRTGGRGRGRGGEGGGRRGGGGHGGGGPAARFERMDTDGDGKLRGGEIGQRMLDDPRAADGEVTLEEFEAAWEELFSGGGGGHHHHGGGHGGGRHGNRGGRRSRQAPVIADAQFILLFDQNRDRRVSEQEIKDALRSDLETRIARELGLSEEQTTNNGTESSAKEKSPTVETTAKELASPKQIVANTLRAAKPRAQSIAICLLIHSDATGDNLLPTKVESKLPKAIVKSELSDWLAIKEPITNKKVYDSLLTAFRRHQRKTISESEQDK